MPTDVGQLALGPTTRGGSSAHGGPVAREAISVSWDPPEPQPQTTEQRIDALGRSVRRQEDIARWLANRERATIHELIRLRRFVQDLANDVTPHADAKAMWAWILDQADANQVIEDVIMRPHRPATTAPEPPPHDLRDFSWDECKVVRRYQCWWIQWRDGNVEALRPHRDPDRPPVWEILAFPTRKQAQAELDRYRADFDDIRHEWKTLTTGKAASDD